MTDKHIIYMRNNFYISPTIYLRRRKAEDETDDKPKTHGMTNVLPSGGKGSVVRKDCSTA